MLNLNQSLTLTTLICDCNQTQRLDPQAMGRALTDPIQAHTLLCRREAGAFLQALQSGEPLTVACTQERALFEQLADETAQAQGRSACAPIQFVNIRETAGWSDQGPQAAPKMAGLYPPGSETGGDTTASPKVWQAKADFDARMAKFGADAKAASAAITDEASFRAEMPKVLQNCGSCHEVYRIEKK